MKVQSPQEKTAIMKAKRDQKAADHLAQYAPIWLAREDILLDEDAIMFEAVFLHPRYGWVKRRYFFDSYNNVLYQRGQVTVAEDDTYALQAQDPYLAAEVLNTVNSYGG
jgi:hypothetical protein